MSLEAFFCEIEREESDIGFNTSCYIPIHWAYDNDRLDAIPFMKIRLSTPGVPKPVPRMLRQLF